MSSTQYTKSTTILMIHFHSMQNAGDAAQLEGAILNLRSHFHEPQIWVAANHPNESELLNLGVKVFPSLSSLIGVRGENAAFNKIFNFIKALIYLLTAFLTRKKITNPNSSSHSWATLFNAYRNADLVVSVPGNIFFTMGYLGFPFLCSSLAVLPALIFKKPFYVMPQSIGPLQRWQERWILKKLYQHAEIIYLREPISYQLAKEIGLPMDRVRLVLDQTIEIRESADDKIPDILQKLEFNIAKISIGVTVIPRIVKSLSQITLDRYYQALAGSLSSFVLTHGSEIYFFPQVTGPAPHEDDRKAFQAVTSLMICPPENIKIVDERLDHNTLRLLYRRMDLFLASRLHSGLFAMSYAIPTVLIAYSNKTKGIMEMLNLQEWQLDIIELDQQILNIKLETLWQQRIHVSSQIRQNIMDVLKRSPDPGFEIAKEFYDYAFK